MSYVHHTLPVRNVPKAASSSRPMDPMPEISLRVNQELVDEVLRIKRRQFWLVDHRPLSADAWR